MGWERLVPLATSSEMKLLTQPVRYHAMSLQTVMIY